MFQKLITPKLSIVVDGLRLEFKTEAHIRKTPGGIKIPSTRTQLGMTKCVGKLLRINARAHFRHTTGGVTIGLSLLHCEEGAQQFVG